MDADREAEAEEAIELRDALLGAVAGTASELSERARELTHAAEWLPWQKRVMLTLLTVQTACMAALGVIALTNKSNTEATKQATAIILDCTTPPTATRPAGECYRRNAASQGQAIGAINTFTLIAVQCAHEEDTVAIEACVKRKAKEKGLVK